MPAMNVAKESHQVSCVVCGRDCKWLPADDEAESPFGGWYCESCDVFSETDVEVED